MLKRLIKNIYYYDIRNFKIVKKKQSNFSYGNFLLKNPTATKTEKKEAIKKFLDNTRN